MSPQQIDAATEGPTDRNGGGCCAGHALGDDELASDLRTLSAVSNETRYEVLRLIADADGDVCVCELEPALGVSQGAVSQALTHLFGAGLVTRRKDGRWRYYDATARAERLLETLDEIRADEGDTGR